MIRNLDLRPHQRGVSFSRPDKDLARNQIILKRAAIAGGVVGATWITAASAVFHDLLLGANSPFVYEGELVTLPPDHGWDRVMDIVVGLGLSTGLWFFISFILTGCIYFTTAATIDRWLRFRDRPPLFDLGGPVVEPLRETPEREEG